MDSYQQKAYERDRKSVSRLCAGFAVAAVVLWPASYLISGNAPNDAANWWNATTVVAWLAAVITSGGFGISAAVLQFICPPIEGANH